MAALERMNGIRLVLFIFAALLPTVKLMGMSGLQGTQAFVGMFVGSYIVVEFMVLLASRAFRSADDSAESLSAQQASLGEHLSGNLQSFLYKVDLFCFSLAFLSHLGLLANALSQVLAVSFPTRILKILVGTLQVVLPVLLIFPRRTRTWGIIFFVISACCFVLVFFLCISIDSVKVCFNHALDFSTGVSLSLYAGSLVIFIFLVVTAIASLRDNPHLLSEKGLVYHLKRQYHSVFAWMYFAFLASFILSLLWHCTFYDPTKTSHSGWINFG